MAEKRMFSKQIIDSDAFLDMPLSAQALYFHLSMRADDDGFIDNPNKIQRIVNASADDLKLLIAKRYILKFESGVIVIKHWRIHNTLKADRYKPTVYLEEKKLLEVKENKSYTELKGLQEIPCFQNGTNMETQCSIDKVSIGLDKIIIDNSETEPEKPKNPKVSKHKYGEFQNVLLTDEEYDKLMNDYSDHKTMIQNLDEYIEMKGAKYKNHYLTMLNWKRKESDKPQGKKQFSVSDLTDEDFRKAGML